MDRDYGVSLDRALAVSRIILAVLSTVVFGDAGIAILPLVLVYLALKCWLIADAGNLKAHIASGTAGSLFWLIIAVTQAWSASWGSAVLSAGLAFDSYAYHRASLRRVAFFNARRK